MRVVDLSHIWTVVQEARGHYQRDFGFFFGEAVVSGSPAPAAIKALSGSYRLSTKQTRRNRRVSPMPQATTATRPARRPCPSKSASCGNGLDAQCYNADSSGDLTSARFACGRADRVLIGPADRSRHGEEMRPIDFPTVLPRNRRQGSGTLRLNACSSDSLPIPGGAEPPLGAL